MCFQRAQGLTIYTVDSTDQNEAFYLSRFEFKKKCDVLLTAEGDVMTETLNPY